MSTSTDTTTATLAAFLTLPDGASVKNRLVKAAMSEQLAGPANQPTAELARAYRRWAHGGSGLIITGNVMIDRRSIGEPLNVVVEDDRDLEPVKRCAGAAKSDSATAPAQISQPNTATITGTAGVPPTTEPPRSPKTSQWPCWSTASCTRAI